MVNLLSPSPATKPIKSKGLYDAAGANGATYDEWSRTANADASMPSIAPQQVDDSVVNKINEIMKTDSPLMQLARTEGAQIANRRGLLNSSMAAGSTQDAMVRAAQPLASQDASQDFQRNAAARAFEYNMTGQDSDQQHQAAMQGKDIASREKLTFAQIESTEGLAAAQRQLDQVMQNNALSAADRQQIRDISSREGMAAAERALNDKLQARDIASREKLAADQTSLQWQMQGRDLGFQSTERSRDREQARILQDQDATQRYRLQQNELSNEYFQRQMDRQTQERLASWNLSSNDRNAAAQFLTNMEQLYQSSYASIMANTALDATQRTAQLTSAKNLRDRQLNFVEQMYDIDLEWGQAA